MKLEFMCPKCKLEFKKEGVDKDSFKCIRCGIQYSQQNGIYDFIPKDITEFKKKEGEFHSYIVESYHDTAQLDTLRNKKAHNDFLKPLTNMPENSLILELGCGLGQDGRTLMKHKMHVVQSDISKKTLEKAKENAEKKDLRNNDFVLMDSENIPFKDNFFDATFMVASLHHMMDPLKAIREMKRCTKEKGLIVIAIEPNKWQYYTIFPFIRFNKKYIKKSKSYSPGDESTLGFSKKDFKSIAAKLDIKIHEIKPVWFVNGFIHVGSEAIYRLFNIKKRVRLPLWMEISINTVDVLISHVPIMNMFPWHWTVIMVKK